MKWMNVMTSRTNWMMAGILAATLAACEQPQPEQLAPDGMTPEARMDAAVRLRGAADCKDFGYKVDERAIMRISSAAFDRLLADGVEPSVAKDMLDAAIARNEAANEARLKALSDMAVSPGNTRALAGQFFDHNADFCAELAADKTTGKAVTSVPGYDRAKARAELLANAQ